MYIKFVTSIGTKYTVFGILVSTLCLLNFLYFMDQKTIFSLPQGSFLRGKADSSGYITHLIGSKYIGKIEVKDIAIIGSSILAFSVNQDRFFQQINKKHYTVDFISNYGLNLSELNIIVEHLSNRMNQKSIFLELSIPRVIKQDLTSKLGITSLSHLKENRYIFFQMHHFYFTIVTQMLLGFLDYSWVKFDANTLPWVNTKLKKVPNSLIETKKLLSSNFDLLKTYEAKLNLLVANMKIKYGTNIHGVFMPIPHRTLDYLGESIVLNFETALKSVFLKNGGNFINLYRKFQTDIKDSDFHDYSHISSDKIRLKIENAFLASFEKETFLPIIEQRKIKR